METKFGSSPFQKGYVQASWMVWTRRSCENHSWTLGYQSWCKKCVAILRLSVVDRSCLPFISSFPTPHVNINFSTTAPQHMLPTHQMSCPITCPHSALTHFTFNFPLTIFLVILSLFFPMFIPVVLIHDPNFLLILLCPAFPIPQANIASSIFSPV